jgi:ABC-2 type transport system ATP-binding protein
MDAARIADPPGSVLRAVLGTRPATTLRRRAADLIGGTRGAADQNIRTLSGGQRRRLDAAVGIVGRPELLFLDEPTAGFDPEARRDFHGLVRRLVDLEDTTILLTTHDLDEAERLADRILILAGGRIVADGSVDELASSVSREAEVRWRHDGDSHAERTTDPTAFVRDLFSRFGDEVTDLDMRRTTLEDTYLAMVHRHESGAGSEADAAFEEIDR